MDKVLAERDGFTCSSLEGSILQPQLYLVILLKNINVNAFKYAMQTSIHIPIFYEGSDTGHFLVARVQAQNKMQNCRKIPKTIDDCSKNGVKEFFTKKCCIRITNLQRLYRISIEKCNAFL